MLLPYLKCFRNAQSMCSICFNSIQCLSLQSNTQLQFCSEKKIHFSAANTTATEGIQPEQAIVEQVVNNLRNKGNHVMLPLTDKRSMDMFLTPFRILMNAGVDSKFLINTCTNSTNFFFALVRKSTTSLALLHLLVSRCLTSYYDAITVFS